MQTSSLKSMIQNLLEEKITFLAFLKQSRDKLSLVSNHIQKAKFSLKSVISCHKNPNSLRKNSTNSMITKDRVIYIFKTLAGHMNMLVQEAMLNV